MPEIVIEVEELIPVTLALLVPDCRPMLIWLFVLVYASLVVWAPEPRRLQFFAPDSESAEDILKVPEPNETKWPALQEENAELI